MKRRPLRQFAKRYGTPGLLLASAYLAVWRLWAKRRTALLICLALFGAGVYILDNVYHRSVSNNGLRLYLGRSNENRVARPALEQQLLNCWEEGSVTEVVRRTVQAFAQAVARHDRSRSIEIGNWLARYVSPRKLENRDQDGRWLLRAVVGQIFLEQGWLEEAENDFQSVLAAVPPGDPEWGTSSARQTSAYGLARISALRGSYREALKWLAQAPLEYNSGCGNHEEAEADHNHPLEVVWTVAAKPFSTAVTELQAVMRGHFAPRPSGLNGDTSEEQRQDAAIEAALTLGCLYDAAGRRTEAAACWNLAAANGDARQDATIFAGAMLDRQGYR